jgi:hypothetical protein
MAEELPPEVIDRKRIEYQYYGWGNEWALTAAAIINELRRQNYKDFDESKHSVTPMYLIHTLLGDD